jgi:peptide/nickel transport system substrate-binding protein
MRRAIIASLVILALLAPLSAFAGGKTETPQAQKTEPQKAPETTAQPATKEAKEAAAGVAAARFPGIVEIDYSQFEIGKPGGQIVIATLGDPKSFNLITAAETSSTDILGRVYEGVVDRNPLTLEYEPRLAEKWEIASDNLSATFTMRKGVVWSDGKPITAQDVVYTINDIILNPTKDDKDAYILKTNSRDSFRVGDAFMKIELLDDYRFKVTLPSLYAGLLNAMSVAPVPKHIFEPLIKEKGIGAVNSFWGVDTDVTKVVGSGPFLIEQYVPSQKIVLKKNPTYWMKDAKGQQLPYLDKFVYLVVDNQNTQALKFQSKEIDIYGLRGADVATLMPKKQELGFELYNGGPAASTTFFVMNQNPAGVKDPVKLAWFNDRRFRTAMAYLIDKETIINNLMFGFGFPQDSFIPTFSPYYWKDAPKAVPQYDPEKAKKLLDEMDLKDRNGDGIREDAKGNRVAFNLITNSGNTVREGVGNLLASEAKKVGVDITFKPGDFNAMVNSLTSTFDWEGIIIGLTGSVDPISGQNVYPSTGNLHMVEPMQQSARRDWEKDVDKWWDYANLTLDENKRKEGFQKIQEIWLKELPWIYTTNEAAIYGFRSNIGNVKPRPVLRGDRGIVQWLYVK